MVQRTAQAEWQGKLEGGQGTIKLGSGAYEGSYSYQTRFGEAPGTNPEELIAGAHAGCFSMALAAELGQAGHIPERIRTKASVTLEKSGGGFAITRIALDTEAHIPGIDEHAFQQHADSAKRNCPVSRALAGTEISLNAKLV